MDLLGGASDAGLGSRSVYFALSGRVRDFSSRQHTKLPTWPSAGAPRPPSPRALRP